MGTAVPRLSAACAPKKKHVAEKPAADAAEARDHGMSAVKLACGVVAST